MNKRSYDPWYLEMDHLAAPCTPAEAETYLRGHAKRLGITIIGTINDMNVMAFPDGEATRYPKHRPRPVDKEAADA